MPKGIRRQELAGSVVAPRVAPKNVPSSAPVTKVAPVVARSVPSTFTPGGPAPVKAQPNVVTPWSGFSDPQFDMYLDAETNSRARGGNSVRMLFDGVQSFAERAKLIEGAKESINFQTFIFNSDETGWALAKMLAEKAKQGVKVRVIYDSMGSNRADPKMFEMMKAAGVEVRPYGPLLMQFWDLNDRWHEKHLIVDGKTSIEGGMNIANEYALGGSGKLVFSRGGEGSEAWRDADVELKGPAVADAQAAFLRNWKELGPDVSEAERAALMPKLSRAPDGVSVRVVQHRPDEEGDQNVTKLYLKAIATSTKSITIENAYFVPPKELREALIAAAQRGVEVKIMTNSRESNDFGAVSDAARYFYDELIAAGVQIFEKQGGTLHAKTATFDGAFSIVGSANLNGRSKGRDSEVVLGVKSGDMAKQLEDRFASGLAQAKEVTAAELENESMLTNLRQWAFSTLAWTF